jgi:hypothetical protein
VPAALVLDARDPRLPSELDDRQPALLAGNGERARITKRDARDLFADRELDGVLARDEEDVGSSRDCEVTGG